MKRQSEILHGWRISQETLKLIACVTMLLDHIGAVFMPGSVLRDIGRISFPIFCFLLAEGVYHTRNPRRYALRLGIGMLLAELPFDLAFFGGIYWGHQNVMLTLLLGFLAMWSVKSLDSRLLKVLLAGGLAMLAEWLKADYGGTGVVLVLLFGLTREMRSRNLVQALCMLVLFAGMPSIIVLQFGGFPITQQMLATLAIVPIALYSGEKKTVSKAVQTAFYLFYPVHLVVLYVMTL